MGLYASVGVKCPIRRKRTEVQSKGGNGENESWRGKLEDCPADVLSDINRHAPLSCKHCGAGFTIVVTAVATVSVLGDTANLMNGEGSDEEW